MTGPEFMALHPGADISLFSAMLSQQPLSFGPNIWRVKVDGQVVEMPDRPGVLAEIHARLNA